MGDTATALRLLRAHLAAASAIVDALDPQTRPEPAPPDEPEEQPLACPNCGEKREAKFDEFKQADEGGHLSVRVTCLSCGQSFTPKPEEVACG